MPATSTAEYIAAKNDPDLLSRLIAKAEMMQITNPADFVNSHLVELMRASIGEDATIVSVFAWAKNHREQHIAATPDLPGRDLSAVTDAHLEAALAAVQTPTTPA